jgi:hypothetical protein
MRPRRSGVPLFAMSSTSAMSSEQATAVMSQQTANEIGRVSTRDFTQ